MKMIWTTEYADRMFSKLILARDPVCAYCQMNPSTDASHFYERGQASVRFNVWNLDGFCRLCHSNFHANRPEYAAWKVKQLGMKNFVALQRLAATTKKLTEEIIKIMKIFNEQNY